jgi:hypothetical protein
MHFASFSLVTLFILLSNPENGGSFILRNVSSLIPDYKESFQRGKIVLKQGLAGMRPT